MCECVSAINCIMVIKWILFQPYDHKRVVARYQLASREHIQQAIDYAMRAREEWDRTPFEER